MKSNLGFKRKIWEWIKRRYKIRSKDLLIQKYRNKIGRVLYKKKYDSKELIEFMKMMGLKKGSNIFIHSSWNEFYNYTGTISEFIDAVIAEIGPTGTLAMPCYPLLRKTTSIFSINTTPTKAGLIAETFRHYPNVKRSVNIHSVCALGPMSDFLTAEHKFSLTSWDEKSPYYKLSKINAIVFTLGLGKYFVGTIMHCADSILRVESPYFSQFFTKQVTYKFRLENKLVLEQDSYIASDDFSYRFTNRSHNHVIKNYFDNSKYKRLKLSNLTVNVYNANYFIKRAIELGRKGIVVYLKPNPKKYFN